MNKNTLIAHTDAETTFISLSKMDYDDDRKTEYTVTVITNPNYGYDSDDFTLTCKSFRKAWDKFKDMIAHHDIGGLYLDDFDEIGSVAIAWANGTILDLQRVYECGWSLEKHSRYYETVNGEERNYSYDEYSHLADAIKALKEKAEAYKMQNIHIAPYYEDEQTIAEIDRKHDSYIREEMYRDACLLETYNNDSSLMRRYEKTYCEE